jgi:hypothetical protein
LQLSESIANDLITHLKSENIFHKNIISHQSNEKVILWGNGYQSKWIKNKTLFGKAGKVSKIISNEEDLNGIDLTDENLIICPAAIQSLPDIYKQIKKSKVTDKVVFGVFI